MDICLGCKQKVINSECIMSEGKLSFEYTSLDDILKKLDDATLNLKKALTVKIDKKSVIKSDHEYVTDYINDIISQIELINKNINKTNSLADSKITVNSKLASGEKTITQLFSVIFKELEGLKSGTSSLYTS